MLHTVCDSTQGIIVSKSYEYTSAYYADAVTVFQNFNRNATYELHTDYIWTDYIQSWITYISLF